MNYNTITLTQYVCTTTHSPHTGPTLQYTHPTPQRVNLHSSLNMHARQHITLVTQHACTTTHLYSLNMHALPPPNHSPLSPIIQHPLITSTYTRFRNSLNATKRTLRAALCEAALTQHACTTTHSLHTTTHQLTSLNMHAPQHSFQLHETLLLLLLIILL